MGDQPKFTHPRLSEAVAVLNSPAGRQLPPGWNEVIEELRTGIARLLELTDRLRPDIPAADPAGLPRMWRRDKPGAALFRVGWPAAAPFYEWIHEDDDNGVVYVLQQLLTELSEERRANLFRLDALGADLAYLERTMHRRTESDRERWP